MRRLVCAAVTSPQPPPAAQVTRLAHNVRRPLTRPDSPVVLCVARAACPEEQGRHGASTPARLANTIPRPLLDRFHLVKAKTIHRRVAMKTAAASIRRGDTSCDDRRADPAWYSDLPPPPPWQPPALGPSWTNLIRSKAHRSTASPRLTQRPRRFDFRALLATSRGHTWLDA